MTYFYNVPSMGQDKNYYVTPKSLYQDTNGNIGSKNIEKDYRDDVLPVRTDNMYIGYEICSVEINNQQGNNGDRVAFFLTLKDHIPVYLEASKSSPILGYLEKDYAGDVEREDEGWYFLGNSLGFVQIDDEAILRYH